MKHLSTITLLLVSIGILSLPHLLFAQNGFVPLTNIPGVTDTTNIGDFFNAAFRLGLIVATILAVVMISLGGIEYMTTESITGKSGAKDRIQDAVIGLLIALLIWIILNTINPNLLKFNFILQKNSTDTSQVQPTTNKSVEKVGTMEAYLRKKCNDKSSYDRYKCIF